MSDSDICSMCLELLAERCSKILPCFHVFCLACLEELAQHAAMKPEVTPESSKEFYAEETNSETRETTQPKTFPCPTCRSLITVPAGGVAQFQTNVFRVREESKSRLSYLMCDLCDGSREAIYSCTDCRKNFCSSCDHYHRNLTSGHHIDQLVQESQPLDGDVLKVIKTRVEEQAMIIEKALAQLWEEESKIEDDRKLIADQISERFNTLMSYVKEARQKSEMELELVTQAARDNLHRNKAKARQILSSLWQTSQPGGTFATRARMQASLISDEEMKYYKHLTTYKNKQCNHFSLETNDAVISPETVQAYMGSVTYRDLTDGHIESFSLEVAENKDDSINDVCENKTQETDGFQTEDLSEDWKMTLQDLISKTVDLVSKYTLRQEEIVPKLLQDRAILQSDISNLCQTLLSSRESLNKGTDTDVLHKCEFSNVGFLQVRYGNITEIIRGQVLFNACLYDAVLLRRVILGRNNSIFVFDRSIINVDNCYNERTGVFTAAVTGSYVFIVSIVSSCVFNSLTLYVDDKVIRDLCSITGEQGVYTSLAHVKVQVKAGQQVFMKCDMRFDSMQIVHGFQTYFTGALLWGHNCGLTD